MRGEMETFAKMLLSGEDGQRVLELLRRDPHNPCKQRTPAALNTALTRLRAKVFPKLPPPDLTSLHPFAHEDGVAHFLTLPLTTMIKVQREHEVDPDWSEEAETALASLCLLPANVTALRMSKRDLVAFKRDRETALLKKQDALLHVEPAGQWLEHAITLARLSTVDMSTERLAIPLLLLSGRRTSEILNGKSTFSATTRPTVCVFTGALKKRGVDATAEIPLLCDFETFRFALSILREKQGGLQLEPVACNNEYHRRLKDTLPSIFPFCVNPHTLRGVYAQMVYHLYSSDVTFNRVAMKVLLHDELDVSLSYNSVELHEFPFPAGCLGALP